MAVLDFRDNGFEAASERAGLGSYATVDGSLAVTRSTVGWQHLYLQLSLASDFSAAALASAGAYLVRWGNDWNSHYLSLVLLAPIVWIALVAASRGYETRFLGVGSEEFRRVGRAAVALSALTTFVSYLANYALARGFVLLVLPLVGLLSLAGRYLLRRWLHGRRRRGQFMHRVVAVGHERPVVELIGRLGEAQHHGLQIVAACLPEPGQRPALLEAGVPVLGGYGSVGQAVRLAGADTVAVLAAGDLGPDQLRRLAWELEPSGAELLVAPSLVEVAGPRLSIRPVSGLPLLHVEQPSFSGGRRLFKNVFDRCGAAAALIVLSPFLAVIGAAIRLTSSGPAIFTQERIGQNGEPFRLYKFRSMVDGADEQKALLTELNDRDGLMFKMHEDPRVTPVGAWLRRYSLDELPQLVNVLLGHMSLVGPRPPLPEEVEGYADHVHRRLLVPPGVTGLWQVSGRADLSWEESVRLDLRYVDNWSWALDLQILWKTVRAVVAGHGAY